MLAVLHDLLFLWIDSQILPCRSFREFVRGVRCCGRSELETPSYLLACNVIASDELSAGDIMEFLISAG